jgi:hypothetical protein
MEKQPAWEGPKAQSSSRLELCEPGVDGGQLPAALVLAPWVGWMILRTQGRLCSLIP